MAQETDLGPQTIDQVTTLLTAWARDVTDVEQISQSPPKATSSELEITVLLLDVLHKPPLRGPRPAPRQVWLRYLVSAWGPEPTAAHHALHQLVFSALARPDLEVGEDSIPAALWAAIGAPPRPAFVLRRSLRVEPYERSAPLVRRADVRPIVGFPTLHGRLLAPNAGPEGETIALSGARIELPGTRASVTSDRNGYFRLDGVPSDDDHAIHLLVRARGLRFEITVHERGTAGAPATIELPWPTGKFICRLQNRAGNPLKGVRVELPERQQYTVTRADGRFILDGLRPDLDPGQIVARQGRTRLDTQVQDGVVVLTGQDGASGRPVVIQLE